MSSDSENTDHASKTETVYAELEKLISSVDADEKALKVCIQYLLHFFLYYNYINNNKLIFSL